MKKATRLLGKCCVSAFMMLACIDGSYADNAKTGNDGVMRAVGVLKDIYQDYPKEKAICILLDAAEKDTVAYAMNALGLAYMEGIGTERNAEKAIYWLNKAGENGFHDAYHNLGIIYKLGKCGEKQDFTVAYNAFRKGAEAGSDVCRYDAGFMLYKGLGCTQDYGKAMELFQTASDNGNVYATYMLGLCHRNGYGTVQDEEKGIELLNQAATLGYSAAIEEVSRNNPENYLTDIFVSDSAFSDIPASMPEIKADVNDTTMLRGNYSGCVVMYDWSGRHVLGEKPVSMSVSRTGEEISGYLILGTDSVPFKAEITTEGGLKFKKSYVSLNERYTFNGKVRYRLDSADLDIWDDRIRGRLSLYSLSQREPERPMYMELHRGSFEKTANDNASAHGYIAITPNPFDTQFDAIFELRENAAVTARVFDKFGVMIWQQNLGTLEAGKHRVTLSPGIRPGYHVLNISAGKQVLH
ncbi:tetratricopeptide repeat protein, partial [Prevotella sp.]|uniref:tetratricopeptide repeat protein n=1 Tax=Prevotella sp. TaxID=59823 RepID=UPI003FD74F30